MKKGIVVLLTGLMLLSSTGCSEVSSSKDESHTYFVEATVSMVGDGLVIFLDEYGNEWAYFTERDYKPEKTYFLTMTDWKLDSDVENHQNLSDDSISYVY